MDSDGFANIYINARLGYDERIKTVRHELAHLSNDDVYNGWDIRLVEGAL